MAIEDRALKILGDIIDAHSAGDNKGVLEHETRFNKYLEFSFGDTPMGPGMKRIDSIRETIILDSTGFPITQEALENAKREYEVMRSQRL